MPLTETVGNNRISTISNNGANKMNRTTAAIVAALLAIPLPAYAGDPVRFDFAASIKMLDGTVMRIGDAEKGKALTLADVAENALLADYRDEANIDGVEKLKRWTLARKIEETKLSVALSAEDIALIKRLVGKAYNPLVYGEMVQAIDPASLPK